MSFVTLFTFATICGGTAFGQRINYGQHINHGQRSSSYQPSYHIDHHDHVVRDRHGHVIGRYHQDVIHQDSNYVVPHLNSHSNGSYYLRNGHYYHVPQTSNRHQAHRPAVVQFGSFSHVDDLASRLETLTNQFCLDLHYNYSHNPGYSVTYGEAYNILQIAKYIHAAEHQHDRAAIQQKLGGLDREFHHVQDDVRGWSRHHHRQIGQLGILSKMDMIESTIHHLMNDVGVRAAPAAQQAPQPAGGVIIQQGPLNTAPPPTVQ